jgi:hypothetical protein
MKQSIIAEILQKHQNWLKNEGGVRASFSDASFSDANLSDANLSDANLSDANLIRADLRGANLNGADLSGADLICADLRGANLRGANLSDANLSDANLSDANLSGADLRGANLNGADLSGADLNGANLNGADLSGAKGLLTAREFMAKFERDNFGIIVFKKIGNTSFQRPEYWRIESGQFLEEIVNPLPTLECACGVNFGTLQWVEENYPDVDLWRCRIRFEDLADICVPYNTDGKARCGRLELIEKIS